MDLEIKNMERQSHEESKVLWKLELESAKDLPLTPEHQKLVNIVTKKIEDYTLTYEEYVQDIADYLSVVNDNEQEENPKTIVKNMCNHLIEKYGEEVRSEQDQNGPSAVECDGESCEDSNNGSTEVRGQ